MIYIALLFVVCFYLHIATRGEQRLVICKKKSYKRASGFFVSFLILAFFQLSETIVDATIIAISSILNVSKWVN